MLERTSDGILRAAKVGDLGTLRHLHSRGYSLLSIDASGQTALHLASHMGFRDVVRYLIACAPSTILNMADNDKSSSESKTYIHVGTGSVGTGNQIDDVSHGGWKAR
ncbi:hypothetical protein QAD02_011742 [Eretmocerus hayati]|uniref:Uncharacterized protein n=1 Tax=Eretmocerus hayati TaxID=131215 RepID=A0ACC2NZE5_9HYME|nr:hypothetical protein QAD02_011742 [Eretmocerus hayati]